MLSMMRLKMKMGKNMKTMMKMKRKWSSALWTVKHHVKHLTKPQRH